ncbi:MAG: alpha/beta fold hydrolase [Proteobacteria bacterium]|nr:alpha/beta fold hydrolase [Pseudomonadota bacterium]
MDTAETVEVGGGEKPDGTVIWLHGLGADGHDFEPIVAELDLDKQADLRFVFPHAPVRPVTINGGIPMRAWYDVMSLDRSGPQDEAGIRDSAETLKRLIEREHDRGVDYDRVVLAGFSQGGAIAMHTAMRFPEKLAGLMALSTWMPLEATIDGEVMQSPESQPRDLPVLMAHGSFDPMLPIAVGQHARDIMQKAGFDVQWHEFPMAHAVCAEEIAEIRRWLLSIFANS